MKIEVLGSRGKVEPSAPAYEKHTGFIIDETILLDVGEPEYLERDPEAIVFTHFHPDHAFFVYNDETFAPGVPHFGPQEHPLIPNLGIIEDEITINGYYFKPIPVIHALSLKSWGYVVEKDGKRIFFTGDVAWIEKKYLEEIGRVDLVVTESTIMKKGGRINRSGNKIYGHTGIPDLVRILSPLTEKIVFTHYGDWFFEDVKNNPDKIKALEKEGLQIIPAYDGFTIEI